MSAIDVEKLLQPLSDDAPCGDNLEYDPAFGELEREAQGRAEQQIGDNTIAAEPPKWSSVRSKALELLGRTKDMRVALLLGRATLHTDGITGLSATLALIRGYIDRYWDTVHPALDPEDDNDPTLRVNTLAAFCAPDFLDDIRRSQLVSVRTIGKFSFRDVEIASGNATPAQGEEPAQMGAIDAAFIEAPLEEVQAVAEALTQAVENAEAIEKSLTEKVGINRSADLSGLPKQLRQIQPIVVDKLSRRGVTVAGGEGAAGGDPAAAAPQPVAGDINSREDVVRMLDKMCDYFHRHEPSSPIPLLLQRAKRLVSKSFLEALQDVAPDAMKQAKVVLGGKGD